MKRVCPISGELAEIVESNDEIIVEQAKLGRYVLDAGAHSVLSSDAETRTRMARWIAESHSLGIDIPRLTVEHVHFFQRLTDLEERISNWHDRRHEMKSTDEERLWKKLRLEWNYNSNHIEGNSLTYHETELLLMFGRTAGGHPLRDYEEMRAHDVAIDHTRRLAQGERLLGEGDIRDLNQILLEEPFWQTAETPDGQPTRKRIVPGQYKTQPNHVRTATGELHRFAEPEDTPARMAEWTRNFHRDLARHAYPLPMFLAASHWRFLRIHPFDDGNGRTARLLANYALLRRDLPPIVIRSRERDHYIGALQNADVDRRLPLADFMLRNLLRSIDLAIRAAKGKSIREPEDMVKEIGIFVRRKKGPDPNKSDLDMLDDVFLMHVNPVIQTLDSRFESLSPLFRRYFASSSLSQGSHTVNSSSLFERENWENTKQSHIVIPGFSLGNEQGITLKREYRFQEYTGTGDTRFDLTRSVTWKLGSEGFLFEITTNRAGPAAISQRIAYSELEGQTTAMEPAIDQICRSMMNEIDGRSKGLIQ